MVQTRFWLTGLWLNFHFQGIWVKLMTQQKFWLRGVMLAQLSSKGISGVFRGYCFQPMCVSGLRWLKKLWSFVLCFSFRWEDESKNYNRTAEAIAAGYEESQVCPGACTSLHSALRRCPPGMNGWIMGIILLFLPFFFSKKKKRKRKASQG